MRRIGLLVIGSFTTLLLLGAAPAKWGRSVGQGGTIDKLEILDISIAKGQAAIKVVSHDDGYGDEAPGSVNCKYGGMEATPKSGVTLATWTLAANSPGQAFDVYRMTSDPAACSSAAASAKNLADAKAKIASVGLDIAKKPALIPFKDGGFALPGGKATVKVVQRNAPDGEGDAGMGAFMTATVTLGGKAIHSVEYSYGLAGAGRATLELVGAWVEGNKVVFVQKASASNMGSPPSYTVTLSPVINL
ncbi:MAG: hypothetical protein Q8O67_00315 [Deltaproteobacteria bacterium]|nr:hypothetical protein [Deltaproteobacteria bacterium]